MKIKDGNKEIYIRDSITGINTPGKNNPITATNNTNNEIEKTLNLDIADNFLIDNIKSNTLEITKDTTGKSISIENSLDNSYTGGKGIEITEDKQINISTRKLIDDISINGKYVEWSGTTYAKVDLTPTAKGMLESTGIEIYEPSSEYSWNTNRYIDKCNENINETVSNKKLTVLKFNNTYFYPFTIKNDIVISSALTYFSSKVSIIYVICVKDKDMIFYVSPTSNSKIDPDDLL